MRQCNSFPRVIVQSPALKVFQYPTGYDPGKQSLILQLTLPEQEAVLENSLVPLQQALFSVSVTYFHAVIFEKKRQYQPQTIKV